MALRVIEDPCDLCPDRGACQRAMCSGQPAPCEDAIDGSPDEYGDDDSMRGIDYDY